MDDTVSQLRDDVRGQDCRFDYRDLTIEDLAQSEATLRERTVSLEADVQSYRELAVTAIEALAFVTQERNRFRRQLYRLLDERRAQQLRPAA